MEINRWKLWSIGLGILSLALIGYIVYKSYQKDEAVIEIVQVRKELSDMNKLLMSLDSLSSLKVGPAIYKISKNYYEIRRVERVSPDSIVDSINRLLQK